MALPDFQITVTIPSPVVVTLPFVDFGIFDCVVDWGDGSATSAVTAYNDPAAQHGYVPGTYDITISGFCSWAVASGAFKNYLTDIKNFGSKVIFLEFAFMGCSNLGAITATNLPGLSRNSGQYFFSGCTNLVLDFGSLHVSHLRYLVRGMMQGVSGNPDITGWKFERAEYFQNIVRDMGDFNQDISGWQDYFGIGTATRTVETIQGMFDGCTSFNCGDAAGVLGTKMRHWRVYSLADIARMFNNCRDFNQQIDTNVQNAGQPDEYTAWDVSAQNTFVSTFNGAQNFDQDLSSWDVSSSTTFNYMFAYSGFNNGGVGGVGAGLDNWNVSNATNFSFMFLRQYNDGFNQYIGSWVFKPAASIDVSGMFQENYNFNQDIGGWTNTSSFTNIGSMFRGATSFNNGDAAGVAGGGLGVGLDTWDTSNVTNMTQMFDGASAFNQYIDSWNPSSITDMSSVFRSAVAFNQPIGSWNVSSVTNMRNMFQNATVFNQPLNSWNTASVTNMSFMFNSAIAFNQPLNSWNTASVTTMLSMFQLASAFDQDLSGWDVHSLTICDSLFIDSNISDANLESTLYAWSLDPLTASNVSALNICRTKTYPAGSNMDLALNDPTNGLVAAKNWNITGITIV